MGESTFASVAELTVSSSRIGDFEEGDTIPSIY